MNKITFVNGQAPALNAYNLNLLQSNVEQAINDITNEYSSNEIIVGKWINGETIYRKVFNFTTSSSSVTTWTNIVEISNNLDKIINMYGYTEFGGNKTPIPRYESSSYYLIFLVSGNYLRYRCVGFTSVDCYLVIEYTKNSD